MSFILACFFPLITYSSDWTVVTPLSKLPDSRSGHSLVSFHGNLYLFGGCNLETKCFNDLLMFDPIANIWKTLETTGVAPEAREGHLAVLVGNLWYIYGGASLTTLLGDVTRLDLEKMEWQEVILAGKATARAYHGGALHDNGLIFIFGGYTSEGLINDILLLDTVNKHWGNPISVGMKPTARKQHSLSRIGSNIYVFGGEASDSVLDDFWLYDLSKRHWYQISSKGTPSPRHGHSYKAHGSKLYIQGGCNNLIHQCYSDLHTYDTNSNEWTTILKSSSMPGREESAMDFIGSALYLFAGRILMEKSYGDMWMFYTDEACPAACSGNGDCTDIGCVCHSGFSGSACEIQTVCRLNCNNHGNCVDFECICFPGYYGNYCQGVIGCPLNCTSGLQGVCQDSSECVCFPGYTGEDCSLKTPETICEELCIHGTCKNLQCICEKNWVGNYCEVEAPIIYSGSFNSEAAVVSSTPAKANKPKNPFDIGGFVEPDIFIKPASELIVNSEEFSEIDQVQDNSAIDFIEEDSTHYLIPEMFGFTDPSNPDRLYAKNLRRDPEKKHKPKWVKNLEDKQSDRDDEIDGCKAKCHYHGVCYSGSCYCEKGYTGDYCQIKKEDIKDGIELSKAIIFVVIVFLVGACIGYYYLNRLMKEIKKREESNVKEISDNEEEQEEEAS